MCSPSCVTTITIAVHRAKRTKRFSPKVSDPRPHAQSATLPPPGELTPCWHGSSCLERSIQLLFRIILPIHILQTLAEILMRRIAAPPCSSTTFAGGVARLCWLRVRYITITPQAGRPNTRHSRHPPARPGGPVAGAPRRHSQAPATPQVRPQSAVPIAADVCGRPVSSVSAYRSVRQDALGSAVPTSSTGDHHHPLLQQRPSFGRWRWRRCWRASRRQTPDLFAFHAADWHSAENTHRPVRKLAPLRSWSGRPSQRQRHAGAFT